MNGVMAPLMPPVPLVRIPDDWTVWAFADAHGVLSGLESGLRAAGLVDDRLHWAAPPGTALVGCGDYIDRGARSREVIDLLRRLESEALEAGCRTVFVRGNHEHELLMVRGGYEAWFDVWLEFGGRATLESFECAHLEPDGPRIALDAIEAASPGIFDWLAGLPHAARWRDTLFVHGGLPPGQGVEDLARRSNDHLWVRGDFLTTAWSSGAFARYEEAGVRRVVFGHTAMAHGPQLFHGGRALGLDANACGSLRRDGAQSMLTLVELRDPGPFERARYVIVPTDRAPDREGAHGAGDGRRDEVHRLVAAEPGVRLVMRDGPRTGTAIEAAGPGR